MAIEHLDFERPLIEIEKNIALLKEKAIAEKIDLSDTISKLEHEVLEKKKQLYQNLTPVQRLRIARHPKRPLFNDYLNLVFTDFIELHGDRLFGDDNAIVGGLGKINDRPVMIIGQEKGRDTKEKLFRNFGTAHPEGYRKALRLFQMADRFKLPIIVFIDTPGAFPGIAAEERGQAIAIAVNLREMINLRVPVIPIIIGEGGSGGALGVGVGDKIIMLEHAYYSVISPEGCAAILWKNQEKVAEAAVALKMTGKDLTSFGLVDQILEEPLGGAHRNLEAMASTIKNAILQALEELGSMYGSALVKRRYEKFRQMGAYLSSSGNPAPVSAKESKVPVN